jgi:hypothetical protein
VIFPRPVTSPCLESFSVYSLRGSISIPLTRLRPEFASSCVCAPLRGPRSWRHVTKIFFLIVDTQITCGFVVWKIKASGYEKIQRSLYYNRLFADQFYSKQISVLWNMTPCMCCLYIGRFILHEQDSRTLIPWKWRQNMFLNHRHPWNCPVSLAQWR